MALNISSLSTHVTAPVNVVLMRTLLATANKRLPYFNGTMPGSLGKNQGSTTVKWRRIENFSVATTALGEPTGTLAFGVGRTPVTPTITDITVSVQKYGNFLIHSEELDLFNVNSRAVQLMQKMGINAGETLNILQRDIFNQATTGRFSGASATATTNVTTSLGLADIEWAFAELDRNSAEKQESDAFGSTNIGSSPVRASYYGICHTDVAADLRRQSGFISVEQYGGYTSTNIGEFGAVNGVRWSATETAPVATSGSVATVTGMRGTSDSLNDVYSSFIYGEEAVGSVGLGMEHLTNIYKSEDREPTILVIQKTVGSSGVGDALDEVGSLGWKGWHAGKILQPLWIQKIESLASDLT